MNSKEAPKESSESPFAGTVEVSLKNLQPQQAVVPFEIGRDVAEDLFEKAFQGSNPTQQEKKERESQVEQFNPHTFALWYRNFPINPRDVVKQYDLLVRHMGYALAGLNEAIPQEVQELHHYVTIRINEYQAAQMKLMRSSSPDIDQLQNHVFDDQFTSACARLLNQMKELGEKLYLRLNEQVVEERRRAFQTSQGAQAVGEKHPFLANRFETSPDPAEKSKRAYEKEVKDGIEVDCYQVYQKLNDKSHLQEQYSETAVRRYIQAKTLTAIQQAIESANLPEQAKVELYQHLPKAVHTFSAHSNEQETAGYFKLDRVIHRNPETEHVLKSVIAALIRGLALTYAAFGDEKQNEDILWAYVYALQPEHITFFTSDNTQYNGPTANAIIVRYPKTGKWLTKEGFFQPLENLDDSFIPDCIALAMKNKNLEFIVKQIRDGLSSQQSAKNTALHQGGAFELFQRSMANREQLEAYKNEAKPEGVTHVDRLDEAVEQLNNLRIDAAMAIHALMEKVASLEEENKRKGKDLENQKYLNQQSSNRASEQKFRADEAEKQLKEAQESMLQFSTEVMTECAEISAEAEGFFRGNKKIKDTADALHAKAQELNTKK